MQSSISKYRITKRVGGGSFGDIYLGVGANGEKVRERFFNGEAFSCIFNRIKVFDKIEPLQSFRCELSTPLDPHSNASSLQ